MGSLVPSVTLGCCHIAAVLPLCCDAPPVMPKSHCGSCPVSSAAKITGIETRSLTQVA